MEATAPEPSRGRPLPVALRVLHWFFIVSFVLDVLYGAYQVFLRRTGTLVTGAPCCDFRFRVR